MSQTEAGPGPGVAEAKEERALDPYERVDSHGRFRKVSTASAKESQISFEQLPAVEL